MDHLINVYQMDGRHWTSDPNSIYGDHLDSLLREISQEWGSRYFEFDFVVYYHRVYSQIPKFSKCGPNVILIFLSDEQGLIPEELCPAFFAILKTYWPHEERQNNIISFPIGYSNSARFLNFIPFEERRYAASYAGNFFPNRLDFFRQFGTLRHLPPVQIRSILLRKIYWHFFMRLGLYKPGEKVDWIPNSRIYFSSGFAKGLPRNEYAEILSNTKIALCPKGYISTECYRLFETMQLGCVIVADELPPTTWFRNSPIIVEKNWLKIRQIVEQLLNSPDELHALHHKTLNWWNTVCSDSASAKYIVSKLAELDK